MTDQAIPSAPSGRDRRLRAHLKKLFRREDGQALVELAMVIPLLLLVLLGIVDFGRAINYWNDENHVASLGARAASVGSIPVPPSGDPCRTVAQSGTLVTWLQCEAGIDSSELQNGSGSNRGVQGGGVSGSGGVCVSVPSTNAVGDPVTVKLTAQYAWLPFAKNFGSGSFGTSAISGSATMRLEAPLPASWITTNGACP